MTREHAIPAPLLAASDSKAQPVDWDSVYAEHLPRVYNFFRYRVGADAEDLTAQTFEKAWRSRQTYGPDLGEVITWLLTIARNVAVDHFRTRRAHAPLDDVDEIAHVTGLTESNVGTILHRTVQTLRTAW